MKEINKLKQELLIMKTENIKSNYSELARLHECDRRTIKKYNEGYEGKSVKRNKESLLAKYFAEIQNKTSIKKEELEELKSILEAGYRLSYNANFFKRETSIEDCRKDNYSSLPSRLHSIYLCDKDGLEYWMDTIIEQNKEAEIFKVLATGTIFKTNEQLLPSENSTYGESYNASFKYWNPKFKNLPNYTNEYLVQGKVKILEKLR